MGDLSRKSRVRKAADANTDPAAASGGGGAVVNEPAISEAQHSQATTQIAADRPVAIEAPIGEVLSNPHNPRDPGNVTELAQSLRDEGQNQAASAIEVDAYLRLWPEDEALTAGKKWVVNRGGRRYKAVNEAGLPFLLIVVDNREATSRENILAKAIQENIHRADFNPMEEARAVSQLVDECGGRQDVAAKQLSKSPAWVNNQVALVRKLHPALQEKVAALKLPKTVAREIARLDNHGDQLARWREIEQKATDEEQVLEKHRVGEVGQGGDSSGFTAVNPEGERRSAASPRPPATAAKVEKTIRRWVDSTPLATVAVGLFTGLGPQQTKALIVELEAAGEQ